MLRTQKLSTWVADRFVWMESKLLMKWNQTDYSIWKLDGVQKSQAVFALNDSVDRRSIFTDGNKIALTI